MQTDLVEPDPIAQTISQRSASSFESTSSAKMMRSSREICLPGDLTLGVGARVAVAAAMPTARMSARSDVLPPTIGVALKSATGNGQGFQDRFLIT
ncbi:MAG: hypothetical protein R3F36_10485 [Candidatus Competibacteraceae bacterium]